MAAAGSEATVQKAGPWADNDLHRRADRYLMVGTALVGSIFLAPIGLIPMGKGLLMLRDAKRRGERVRPMVVTVFGVFILVDAAVNFLGWSLDLFFAHGTHILQAQTFGFGQMIDASYYRNFGSGFWGGVANGGEKALASFSVLVIFPIRFVSTWAFLKMYRWGFRWTVITTWAYVMLWLAYMVNMASDFHGRFGTTLYGVTGWWLFDIAYITPFLGLPLFYALDKRRWDR